MNENITGMVRSGGHATSVAAARGVRRETLKSRVMSFAREAGPFGFLDEELHAIDPTRPESSLRKRRSELSQAGWIVDAGYDRLNSFGQASTVFVHRDHALNPPPLGAEPKPKKHSADDERVAIVAWIRKTARGQRYYELALNTIAEGIEAGNHLK